MMHFSHSDEIWNVFPNLRAAVIVVDDVSRMQPHNVETSAIFDDVEQNLNQTQEGEIPSIQAWRRAYTAMGYKPTQYRCAAEALLRRFRKDRELPQLHPLIDVLNLESMKSAIPIAAFDLALVADGITVRPATGQETYKTFQGETEHPSLGEIIFADRDGQAHSRRWVYRQSAASAVRKDSSNVLIVAEAMHDMAEADLESLMVRIEAHAANAGIHVRHSVLVTPQNRRVEFEIT